MQTELLKCYSAARAASPPGSRVAVLHLGDEHSAIATGSTAAPDQIMALALGLERTARAFFKHTPPLPLEIENAIQVVEDEVMLTRALSVVRPALFSFDTTIGQIACAANTSADSPLYPNPSISLDQVEQLFNQLAARSQGRPASQTDIPDDPKFSVALLILREFMHHLQFQQITVLSRDALKP